MSIHAKYIAIDFGAESGRFIVGTLNLEKKQLSMDEIYRFRTQATKINGQLRWNVIRLWEEILIGLKNYERSYGSIAAGIGIDSWGVSPVGLNEYDDLAFTPFHYRADFDFDERLSNMQEEVGKDNIFDKTGIQFMALNTSTQLWAMQKKFPNLLSQTKTLFLIPDYFYYLLTGKKITEYTNASTTQLLDVGNRNWDWELISKITANKITSEKIPPIRMPGETLGVLNKEIQNDLGLGEIPIHIVATHDTGSAIAAIPHVDNSKGWAYLSSGTWSLLGVEVNKPIINDLVKEYNLTNEGGVDGTIRLLKNIMGLWLLQECKREWELYAGHPMDYGVLINSALKLKNSGEYNEPALIFPDDERFFAPKSMTREIQDFCKETNQILPKSNEEFILCIFNSLVCRYREIIEVLEKITDQKIEQIHIVGGGSKNMLLSEMTANITQKTVITGPVECTAIGNLLMQARANGVINNLSELRWIIKNSFEINTIEPTNKGESWDKLYRRYFSMKKLMGNGC